MLMIEFIKESTKYVMTDQFFILSMAITTTMSLFIGSTLYDGVFKEIKKAMITIVSYACVLTLANVTRVSSVLDSVPDIAKHQPFAGMVTIMFVTFFYALGMFLGVWITKFAHKGQES